MEGLDVYVPLVDDHGVDCIIKKEDGTFIEVQIKARSKDVNPGDAVNMNYADSHVPNTIEYYIGEYRPGNELYRCMYQANILPAGFPDKVTNYTFHYLLSNGYTRVLHTVVRGTEIRVQGSFDCMPRMAPFNIGVLDGVAIDIYKDALGAKLWQVRLNAKRVG